MENENVCRTCLQIFRVNAVTRLNSTEDDVDSISLRQKLQACVPELTVDIVHDPVICETCCAAIILAYQFKSSCLENERNLYKFIRQRKQNSYDLLTTSDLLQIVRKDINEEHSYSFVEKSYSNGHISDSESDGESLQLKLSSTIQNSLEDLVKQALADSSYKSIVDTEDRQETSKAITKAKVKNKKIKQSTENGSSIEEVAKSPTAPINLPKTVEELKTESKTVSINIKHSKTSFESTFSSVNSDNKQQAIKTRRSQSKKENSFLDSTSLCNSSFSQSVENRLEISGIPTNPEITESGCKTNTHKEKAKKRKQTTPKKKILDGTNYRDSKESTKPLSKNIASKENTEIDMEKVNKQNIAKTRSMTNDELTCGSQKKILKKEIYSDMKTTSKKLSKSVSTTNEKQDHSKISKNEIPPSPCSIKKKLFGRDIRSDTIENDILEIKQMILKNDLSEPPNLAHYRRENKRYRCTKCNKAYSFKSHFDVHLKSHIFKKLYTCPICEKDFAQEKYLKSHAMLHTSTGSYQCDICLKYLSASTALKRHYRTHTGEKPYSCVRCGKSFAQKIQLAVHMRTHTGFRPFTCNICKAGFTQKSHLMGHMRIHTGEKPYKCDQCSKCFRKSYALQIHKHSHSVKPFQCRACNFLFKDPDTFQRHVNKHLERIANTGSHVLKKPKSKRKLLEELEQDVKDINMAACLRAQIDGGESQVEPKDSKGYLYSCKVCNREFKTNFSLNRHMKVHVKDNGESFIL